MPQFKCSYSYLKKYIVRTYTAETKKSSARDGHLLECKSVKLPFQMLGNPNNLGKIFLSRQKTTNQSEILISQSANSIKFIATIFFKLFEKVGENVFDMHTSSRTSSLSISFSLERVVSIYTKFQWSPGISGEVVTISLA